MIINPPIVEVAETTARLSAVIERKGQRKTLWFEVPADYSQYLVSERSDAFLLAVLMTAMKENEVITVRGTISKRLFVNLQNYYMHLLTILSPALTAVTIECDSLDEGEAFTTGSGVVMGFSGGVDSFAAVHDHILGGQKNNYRATHLVFNKVNDAEACDSNEQQYKKLASFAKSYNMPYFKIDSNMHDFNQLPFVLSYLIRNISALMAVQKLVGKYVIASSYKYQDIKVSKTYSMGFSESITAPLLATENMHTLISGAQYSRVEKTKILLDIPESRKYLDVCVSSDRDCGVKNCSSCFKCLRTALTLDIIGKLDQYSDVFDIAIYKKNRHKYVARVLRKADEYDREIHDLVKEKNYKFSLFERFWGFSVFYYARKALR